jgi:transposase
MGRCKELLDEDLVLEAQEELEQMKDYKVCIRLKAITSCKDFPINHVSKVMGFHRSTLWNWIKGFKEEGVKALYDKPKGHNPAKLNKQQKERIGIWLEKQRDNRGKPVHWTLDKLLSEVEVVFAIRTSRTALWNVIRGMGFQQKVPRPYHAKADKEKQERFKKNS